MNKDAFDCSGPLKQWVDDPTKPATERMLSLIECYSDAYRLLVIEVRRLQKENDQLKKRCPIKDSDGQLIELQKIVDASITYLDHS